MKHKLTALFRNDPINHDPTRGPSPSNPGGGLYTKLKHLRQALPNIKVIDDASDMGDISIVDVLYFSGGGTEKTRDGRIRKYREHKGHKILWTSDFEILRWLPEHRAQIFDATDIIAGNSSYMTNLLKNYFDDMKVAHLTDPINCDVPKPPKKREKIIYSCSQIILEKGIKAVVSLFKGLKTGTNAERTLKRVFVGSSTTWGMAIRDKTSFELEMAIEEHSNIHEWSLPNSDVEKLANQAWINVSFTKFETFGYAQVEALRGGCTVFASPHGAYKERIEAGVVIPADTPIQMRQKIREHIENNEPERNDASIQFVRDHYGLPVFRKQFKNIVGKVYGI